MSTESHFVKVYNLTDVETPTLAKHHMLNAHVAVGTRMCNPGEFVELEDTPVLRSDVKFLVSIGALALGSLPPPYAQARTAKLAEGGVLSVHIQHLDVPETKVAADPVPAAPAVSEEVLPAPSPEPAPAPEPTPVQEAVPEAPPPAPAPKPAPVQSSKNNRR